MNRWRVGEDRGSKETDGCPLTTSILFLFIIRDSHRLYIFIVITHSSLLHLLYFILQPT
jgi:hypothetical protein